MNVAATVRFPQRGFWTAILFADAVILCLLPKAVAVLLVFGLAALALAALNRPEWILGFMLTGWPLVGTLPFSPTQSQLLFYGIRILTFLGIWWSYGRLGLAEQAGPAAEPRRIRLGRFAEPVLRDRRTWAVLGLLALLWIGSIDTPAPHYAGEKISSFILLPAFLYLTTALLWPIWSIPGRMDRLLRVSILLGGVVAACGLAVSLGAEHELLRGATGSPLYQTGLRLGWLGTNVIWLSRVLAVWIVMLLWAASRHLVRPVVTVVLAAAGLYLMLRTGSRGPLLALILSPLALVWLPGSFWPAVRARMAALGSSSRRNTFKLIVAVLLIAALVLLLIGADQRSSLVQAVSRGPIATVLQMVGVDSGDLAAGSQSAADPTSIFRIQIARRGLELMREGLPWGYGTGAFSTKVFGRDFRMYPHNIFAELLFENGLVGFLLFLLYVLLCWRGAVRLARDCAAARWLWVLFVMALLNAQVSGDLPVNEPVWFWGGMLLALEIGWRRHRSWLSLKDADSP